MRQVVLSAGVLLAAIAATAALAQDSSTAKTAKDRLADDEDSTQEATTDEEAPPADDADYGGGDKDKKEGGDEDAQGAPESYVVKPGDTLWTLSQRFLNNPWYWPKIWSYNPQLDNPNWIYPGATIRFYPGAAPEPVAEQKDEPEVEDEPQFDDIPIFEATNTAAALASLQGGGSSRREFFVPTDRLEDAGRIVNSPEEARWLSLSDRAYMKLKKGQVGEKLQIFEKTRDLRHPVTGANLGSIVELLGEVSVDQTSRDSSLGTITAAWAPIERDNYVGQLPTQQDPVRAVANGKSLKGYVVDAAPAPLSFFGETYVVLVDKGSADGVQVGNTFTVVRAGDPYTREYTGLADEDIGEVLVMEVFKNVSTCILQKASREIVPGDRVEMRQR